MALIQCPECKKNISNMARACPHCGYPLPVNPPPRMSQEQIRAARESTFFKSEWRIPRLIVNGISIIMGGVATSAWIIKIVGYRDPVAAGFVYAVLFLIAGLVDLLMSSRIKSELGRTNPLWTLISLTLQGIVLVVSSINEDHVYLFAGLFGFVYMVSLISIERNNKERMRLEEMKEKLKRKK